MVKKDGHVDLKEILIVVLIFLILLFLFFILKNSTLIPQINISENNLKTPIEVKELTYNDVIDSGNVSDCKFITDIKSKQICESKLSICSTDTCFLDKAKQNKDELECFNITDLNIRASCSASIKYSKIVQSAVIKNNILLCDSLEEPEVIIKCQDNFYFANSVNKNNLSFCSKIQNEASKNECLN